jgi:acetyltransferase-like isoleucine patch superfamily enzyme
MQDDLTFTSTVKDSNPEKKYVIFGPYRCKVHFPNGEWGMFGRGGGIDALRGMTFYPKMDGSRPSVNIGHFCDFSGSFSILTGGEHFNEQVVNSAFAFFPPAFAMAKQQGADARGSYSRGPITLGSNIVVSHGATILSGVTIGHGAVIGAGSVVTRDVPPYAIVAGSPARLLRYRVPEECIEELLRIAWWDWSSTFLAHQMAAIHNLSAREFIQYCQTLTPIAPIHDDGVLVFRLDRQGGQRALQFEGAELGGQFIPIQQLPTQFLDYISQINAPIGSTITVYPHLFSLLDITPLP